MAERCICQLPAVQPSLLPLEDVGMLLVGLVIRSNLGTNQRLLLAQILSPCKTPSFEQGGLALTLKV